MYMQHFVCNNKLGWISQQKLVVLPMRVRVFYLKWGFSSVQVIKAAVGQVYDIAQGNLAAADLSRAK